MSRDTVWRVLAVLAVLLGGWWIQANTEWVDVEQARPAHGEAREHPTYALEHLMRRLDLQVERHEELDRLPPEGARLLLLSRDWDVIPGRAEQLHQWVLRGGHLVLLEGAEWGESKLESWVPIYAPQRTRKEIQEAAAAAKAKASAASSARDEDDDDDDEAQSKSAPPAQATPLSEHATFKTCISFNTSVQLKTKPGVASSWTMHYPEGMEMLRVARGQGSVTVLNTWPVSFYNDNALRCENPLLLAEALQARAGATLWIYLNEKRESLIPWLWHQGWIAITLGLLALAAALWRGALRFGPRVAKAARHRRSIGEQVRGTGAYLHAHGGEALVAAQRRALEDAAEKHIPRYRRMRSEVREQAIAKATNIDVVDLAVAMGTQLSRGAQLTARLQLMETARRRLTQSENERSQS
ncbi:MAG TPA: DUF4350 domain-containing protein [Burkholderiaceae bacterium]|jgi:hypothetical protein